MIDVYINNGSTVFMQYTVEETNLAMGMVVFALFGGLIGFLIVKSCHTNKKKEDAIIAF